MKPNSHMYLPAQGCVNVFTQFKITDKSKTSNKTDGYIVINKTSYKTDGYIVINNYNIFKYKMPTIDVVLVEGYLQLQDQIEAISSEKYENLEEGKIYEIEIKKCSSLLPNEMSFNILRKRNDRVYASTKEQFQVFLENIKYFRKNFQASVASS